MSDETYNGWANRETWAFNLHWQNDQGLYFETLDAARELLAAHPDLGDSALGEHVVTYWQDQIESYEDEFGEKCPGSLHVFKSEVGSWWRIDYAEVGAAVRESLSAEEG